MGKGEYSAASEPEAKERAIIACLLAIFRCCYFLYPAGLAGTKYWYGDNNDWIGLLLGGNGVWRTLLGVSAILANS